ncbi:hypothetical protein [Streptomyces sp. NBC_01304]|uniref:hypothetical protein n=1 Tax=Streptomyces sp. NBC_01304 TaxID=2903818 RepID=UPI002E10D6EA|nr:hypothetical protein OG430_41565 [Streptomyces sp. NBC_01304]
MTDRIYPRVEIIGAPGYADFEGLLLMPPLPQWPNRCTCVFDLDGRREFAVVPERCVHRLDGATP